MIELKKFELNDLPLVREYFYDEKSRNCIYTPGCLFMWRNTYDCRYALLNDTLIVTTVYNGILHFYYPTGKDPVSAFKAAQEYCRVHGIPFILCALDDRQFEYVKSQFGSFSAYAERTWYDYLYDSVSFRDNVGKKYAARRNHIHKFIRCFPDWSYKKIEPDDIPDLIDYIDSFVFHSEKEDETAYIELNACKEVLENYSVYGMAGGVLRAQGKIVGFTAGEIVGDTLFVHIEKADVSFDGAYQMLSDCYLHQMVDEKVKYVNREDDSGDLGLRKSKLSYHPVELLKKTNVFIGG